MQEPNPGPALTALGVDIVPQARPDFSPDIVVLAIKPQMAAQVIPGVAETLPEACLFLSLMAGTSIVTLRDLAGAGHHFIRTMPNTPAALGRGISALVAEKQVPPDLRDAAEWLMQAVGDTVWFRAKTRIMPYPLLGGRARLMCFTWPRRWRAVARRWDLNPPSPGGLLTKPCQVPEPCWIQLVPMSMPGNCGAM